MLMAHYRARRAGPRRDNRPVQRLRAASRLTSWLFVFALLLKSAVPMLASAAAALQGRATADVCDVYGVDTSMLGARAPMTGVEHAHHAHHGEARAVIASGHGAPAQGPAPRVAHGGDHCALSALAFALTSDAPAVAARAATVAPMPAGGATGASIVDPAARWAAQLQHAPPASS
jgi:hypothetical protein